MTYDVFTEIEYTMEGDPNIATRVGRAGHARGQRGQLRVLLHTSPFLHPLHP